MQMPKRTTCMNNSIIETSFEKAKKWASGESIGEDLLLLDRLVDAPFPKEPRRMNFILIGLCTRGSVSYRQDTKELLLTPGHMIIASEHHVIDNYRASADLEGLCMMVSVPFYSEIIRSVSDISSLIIFSYQHPVFPLSERDQQVFRDYFYVIRKKIAESSNHYRHELVRTLMLAMFYDLSNVLYQSSRDVHMRHKRSDMVFTQFIKLVEENCRQERRVSWYAQQLCITPKYLSELVKQCSKRTPNDWIDNYVTLEVRNMLKNSNKSVKQIAEDMHFPNQSFLGKYFKERVGMSPSKYRRFG